MENQNQTALTMAVHAHQPVGNYPHVFEDLTEESYRPFLEAFQQAGEFTIGYHASGPLLKWWEENEPEMIDLLGRLIEEDKLELIAAGFYEPILPIISAEDRKYQIEKYLQYAENTFDTRPRGLWLTERVWIPSLPTDLAPLGIEYTIVDDFHFKAAGWDMDSLSGYYTTEHGGEPLNIFPISQELRYRIPFHDVPRIKEYLGNSEADSLTMADDAEKFGSWPDTQKWIYEDGWLERFLNAAGDQEILLHSPGQIIEKKASSGRCYLPTASYEEMMEWALPTEQRGEYLDWKHHHEEKAKKFGKGGFFNHFLVKYAESNRLHKRMQWLSSQIEKENQPEAAKHLFRAQCNDVYWHGVFGGLCLPNLRSQLWAELCTAHNKLDLKIDQTLLKKDFDRDGRKEIIFQNERQFGVIEPYNGGQIVDWEIYPEGRNVLDSLSRRWESYLEEETTEEVEVDEATGEVESIHHRKTIVPDEWLENWSADPVPRAGFQPVYYVNETLDAHSVMRQNGIEFPLHGSFPNEIELGENEITLNFEGIISEIAYQFTPESLHWGAKRSDEPAGLWGLSLTFGFRSPKSEDSYLETENQQWGANKIQQKTVEKGRLTDELAGVILRFKSPQPLQLITYPVKTISRSEEDAERIYQGTCLVFLTRRSKMSLNWQLTP